MADCYVPVFYDWPEATRELGAAQKGRLIDAIVYYARGEEDWERRMNGAEKYVFPVFRAQIDRAKAERAAKLETLRNNGRRGGRPKKNQAVISETNNNNNDNYNHENQNQNEYEYDHKHESEGLEEEDEQCCQSTKGAAGIIAAWRRNFGKAPNPATVRAVARWAAFYGFADGGFAEEAVAMAAMRNADDPLGYIIALLRDWKGKGISSVDEIE